MIRTAEETTASLEGALEVALGGLAEDVDRDGLRVVERLETHECLDEERLRVPAGNGRATNKPQVTEKGNCRG